jgi:predicted nuclease of predicted toxin-antitoxin system
LKLLLDEMLSPAIAELLRARGHDVEAIKGRAPHEALSDGEVMELARFEHRAVVTNNLVDFRPLHHEAIAGCRHLNWLHCGRLNWPHLRPI